jgi:UDP-N-acetylglucosamine:LPS N-acetylglucosamine transferase
VLLVASSGGHLAHLAWLEPWWRPHTRRWVTFDTPDAQARLAGEVVTWAAHPTNRDLPNLARNLLLARRLLREEDFDLLVTAGAGVAVPFVLAARAAGVPTIALEVWDRMDGPSLTTRLIAPWVDALVCQWPAQAVPGANNVLLGPMR